MENLKNIRLIIFDLDGTLVDSGADITNALNYAIEPFDRPKLSVRDTISLVGEGITSLIDKVMINSDASTKKSVMDRFIKYYSEHLTEHTRPYPGVRETLERLVRHKKAVISNKRESLSKKLLEELGLLAYFDVVLGSDSVNEKKPSPVPVIKVMSMLDAKPEETVIAGDSDFDIKAGKEAGISTVGVTYGFRSRESLQDADFLIDKIDDLLSLTGENT